MTATSREFESLGVEVDDFGVMTCTLNRPESLNAVTTQDLKDLTALWASLVDDDEVRAVVITGAGRAFCAGGDVKGMSSGQLDVAALAMSSLGPAPWKGLMTVQQPVICAVNGPAVGVGIFFPALADLVLAAPAAKFGDPHVQRGLVATGAGALISSIGLKNTKQLLLVGDLIDADEALRIGLINQIVPADELVATATALGRRLASFPQEALRWTKKTINRSLDLAWNVSWDAELALEALSAYTDGHKAAVAAFLDRSGKA